MTQQTAKSLKKGYTFDNNQNTKTPAQDRLKKLQHKLILDQKLSQSSFKVAKNINEVKNTESFSISNKRQPEPCHNIKKILQPNLVPVNCRSSRPENSSRKRKTPNEEFVANKIKKMNNVIQIDSSPMKEVIRPKIRPKQFSANERLKNLQKTLHNQTNSFLQNGYGSVSMEEKDRNYNSNIAIDDPMDWDEIKMQIDDEIQVIRKNLYDAPRIGETWSDTDVISNNLFQKFSSSSNTYKIGNRHNFYIVVDTNIFIQNLKFLDDLTKVKYKDKRPILVVPYSVMQELDKLKMRSSLSVLTSRAIKYINERLESKDRTIEGQSASEAVRHLIEIENADDRILNCCLQIKEETDNIILFSNDINLRNKALCSGIQVCTKKDLTTPSS